MAKKGKENNSIIINFGLQHNNVEVPHFLKKNFQNFLNSPSENEQDAELDREGTEFARMATAIPILPSRANRAPNENSTTSSTIDLHDFSASVQIHCPCTSFLNLDIFSKSSLDFQEKQTQVIFSVKNPYLIYWPVPALRPQKINSADSAFGLTPYLSVSSTGHKVLGFKTAVVSEHFAFENPVPGKGDFDSINEKNYKITTNKGFDETFDLNEKFPLDYNETLDVSQPFLKKVTLDLLAQNFVKTATLV